MSVGTYAHVCVDVNVYNVRNAETHADTHIHSNVQTYVDARKMKVMVLTNLETRSH